MKYGVLSFHDWAPDVEGYPDMSYVIVMLTDSGTVAPDNVMTRAQGHPVGVGLVFVSSEPQALGYVPIPIGYDAALIYGAFDGIPDAREYAESLQRSDRQAIEDKVNAALQLNEDIDSYIDERLTDRRQTILTAAIIIAAGVVLVLIYLVRHGYI